MDVKIQRAREDLSRMFDAAKGDDGSYAYLINRTMYIDSDNISPSMITMYSSKTNDTYTKISYQMYGTIDLWWLVCKMNGITNPFAPLQVGTVLKLLNADQVQKIVMVALDSSEKMYKNSTINQS